jgi:hypothetical protein
MAVLTIAFASRSRLDGFLLLSPSSRRFFAHKQRSLPKCLLVTAVYKGVMAKIAPKMQKQGVLMTKIRDFSGVACQFVQNMVLICPVLLE